MSDKMMTIPFDEMLAAITAEYKQYKTVYGVPVEEGHENIPLGPAAGPHTQLAANLVSAYIAGATQFELKTVQILEGESLHIVKPCIYVAHEVYNTEWSTELTVSEARDEYIKAYLLIFYLGKQYNLRGLDEIKFIMSVGYDFAGIQSEKVDQYLESMQHAAKTEEWKKDITYLKANIREFENITLEDIKYLEEHDTISSTVTLSTMHGCKGEEIEKIAMYLIKEKQLNTYIKMNPTLLGKERVRKILNEKGYTEIEFKEEIFAKDITMDVAEEIIRNCQIAAQKAGTEFGIKLTNTFPVNIKNGELAGSEMYMSGPALYPISIMVAYELAKRFKGKIKISYSGGVDQTNVKALLETGIAPITVSSYLLKPGGYKNLTKLVLVSKYYKRNDSIDLMALKAVTGQSETSKAYDKKDLHPFTAREPYSEICARCNNCVDVCPNRANVAIEYEGKKYVVHRDRLCNECGCCACECIMGHKPYSEKLTIYEDKESFETSENDGILYNGEILSYRKDGIKQDVPELLSGLINKMKKKGRL